jgi:hypothetical protein
MNLVSKDVVVDIVLLWRLGREDEGLHEATHRLTVVRQLTAHLKEDIFISSF